MSDLKDIIIYLFKNYPNPTELSKPRLVKILYLADWRSAFTRGQQVTNIRWFFNHYGPYVEDVISLIKANPKIFYVESFQTGLGGISDRIKLLSTAHQTNELDNEDKSYLDFVIERTYNLSWDEFLSLVYSTYPIENSSKYTTLDLVEFGKEYNQKSLGMAE